MFESNRHSNLWFFMPLSIFFLPTVMFGQSVPTEQALQQAWNDRGVSIPYVKVSWSTEAEINAAAQFVSPFGKPSALDKQRRTLNPMRESPFGMDWPRIRTRRTC